MDTLVVMAHECGHCGFVPTWTGPVQTTVTAFWFPICSFLTVVQAPALPFAHPHDCTAYRFVCYSDFTLLGRRTRAVLPCQNAVNSRWTTLPGARPQAHPPPPRTFKHPATLPPPTPTPPHTRVWTLAARVGRLTIISCHMSLVVSPAVSRLDAFPLPGVVPRSLDDTRLDGAHCRTFRLVWVGLRVVPTHYLQATPTTVIDQLPGFTRTPLPYTAGQAVAGRFNLGRLATPVGAILPLPIGGVPRPRPPATAFPIPIPG